MMANEMTDERIHASRRLLGNPYAYLNGDGELEAAFPDARDVGTARLRLQNQYAYVEDLEDRKSSLRRGLIDPDRLLGHRRRGLAFSNDDIEDIARALQVALWQERARLRPAANSTPLEIIDPQVALEALGFDVDPDAELGEYAGPGGLFDIAGILDRDRTRVQVSGRVGGETHRFTMAHELGHAVLHTGSGLHRDRAHDGSAGRPLNREEAEANTFAGAFLMPARLVRDQFREAYGTETFQLNEESAFYLTGGQLASVPARHRTLRGLSLLLAGADYYDGRHFEALASRFRVSVIAMAIRLEGLGLVRAGYQAVGPGA